MNEITQLLCDHRSIRKYTDRAIEPQLLNDIVVAGQSASTSSFIQSTTIIRVSDKQKRAAIAEMAGNQPYVSSCAEFLVVCADWHRINQLLDNKGQTENDFSWTEQLIAATVDAALFSQNMVIAAESAGLGCCYIGGIRNQPELLSDLLELPDLVFPVFGLCLGYPDQQPSKKPRLPVSAVLKDNVYHDHDAQEMANYDELIRQYYLQRTKGRLKHSWTEQMQEQVKNQTRAFMLDFLQSKGLLKK